MSSSRAVIAVALALVLAGCATTHPSSSTFRDELGAVTVSIGNSRISQLYAQKLSLLFGRHGDGGDRYELKVSLRTSESDELVSMRGSLELYDRTTGTILATKSLRSSASVGAVASLYGSEEAKRHARERLAGHLANQSYHFLLLHFSRVAEAGGS